MSADWGIAPLESVNTPVFIGGIPRSGTTACNILLQQTLSKKSTDLIAMPESFFWDSCREPDNVFFMQSKIAYLGGTTSYVDFYNYVVTHRHNWSRTLDFCDLCTLYFLLAKQQWQLREILEKTPSNVLFADQIFGTFPSAFLVVMIRHPYAVYCSMLKRAVDEPAADWLKMGVEQFSWFYKFYIDKAYEAWQKHGNRVLLYKFEEAVIDPKPILAFIDQGVNQSSKNPFHPGESAEKYFDILKPQLSLLNGILGETMEHLEYPAYRDQAELI